MTSKSPRETPFQHMLGPISCPTGLSGDSRRSLIEFQESLTQPHRSVMRSHHLTSPDDLPFAWRPVEWFGKGHRLIDKADQPSKSLFYAGGDYFLQDAASLLALALCLEGEGALNGKVVCDLCAAPGGKASALLEAVGSDGFLLANEPIRSRVPALRYNLARTGSDRYAVSTMDPERLIHHVRGRFDCVLVDAPCSGQALFSRGKQNAAAFSQKQIDHSARRQERILEAAVELLKPEGKLIYSTCTFAYSENEAQVSRLIKQFEMKPQRIDRDENGSPFVTAGNRKVIESLETEPGCYRVWPHLHQSAGAFAAALVHGSGNGTRHQNSSVVAEQASKPSPRPAKTHQKLQALTRTPQELNQFYEQKALQNHQLMAGDHNVFGFPRDVPDWVFERAQRGFSIIGPELAYRTGKTWKPSHEASLRRPDFRLSKQAIELDEDQAIELVAGQPLRFDHEITRAAVTDWPRAKSQNGWVVAQYRGRPLGWLKCSISGGKNHLPPAIRMIGIEKSHRSV